MDAELKAKWVAALRSGEFKQGEGRLHDPESDSFCCLGVLCKVLGAEWREHQIYREGDDGSYLATLDHAPMIGDKCLVATDDEELAPNFAIDMGIKDQGHLISLNDGFEPLPGHARDPIRKHSFPEIADYIEKNL